MGTDDFSIAGRIVGRTVPPFVVAEMSANHNQSFERALQIVDAAADAGAHALKIQTYTADTLTLDVESDEFIISDENSLWSGRSLNSLYAEAHTPWEWHDAIFERARDRGMVPFSTPFDETAVDFLEELGAPCYKIGSFENAHLPLIRKAAATGKPLIMSTGMATADIIAEAVDAACQAGCRELVLLKCTSTYPASPENCNLATIPDMRERFGLQVGLSDHTTGTGVAIAAVALGATVIEKHLTLSRADGGVDSAFSLEPDELRTLVGETERVWQAMGTVTYGPTMSEKPSMQFRRSLYVAQDMWAGDAFTPENLRIVRPGLGLPPKHFDDLLGRRINRDARKGTALSWDMVGDSRERVP
jgi:pseudaminic acid synthase